MCCRPCFFVFFQWAGNKLYFKMCWEVRNFLLFEIENFVAHYAWNWKLCRNFYYRLTYKFTKKCERLCIEAEDYVPNSQNFFFITTVFFSTELCLIDRNTIPLCLKLSPFMLTQCLESSCYKLSWPFCRPYRWPDCDICLEKWWKRVEACCWRA